MGRCGETQAFDKHYLKSRSSIMRAKRRYALAVTITFLVVASALMFWRRHTHAIPVYHDTVSDAFDQYRPHSSEQSHPCDSINNGYQCEPRITQHWGQYCPFFSVPSSLPTDVPPGCRLSFAQVLSRHGARDPTEHKSVVYRSLVQELQAKVDHYPGKYAFLAHYKYSLGADQLTEFGKREMVNSGTHYYKRYQHLAQGHSPFIRSASQERVVLSAENWAQGFHLAKIAEDSKNHEDTSYPYDIVIISEAQDSNNTLSHGLCTNFETGRNDEISSLAKATWASIFVPSIQTRLNTDLRGANLSIDDVITLMDLCPFETVARPEASISPFCSLFTVEEWHAYSYYQTLGKYYGYSHGNPLGPEQGIGFANELIARLTGQPVKDHTTTNHTLDDSPATFPLDRRLYADFSHDNDMTSIFAALGLYNTTKPLSNTSIVEANDAGGYSAAWTVPFAARAYVEKMRCDGQDEELVRVLVNDRVLPLHQCNGDDLGRCKLVAFVESLSFAARGGNWDKCFM